MVKRQRRRNARAMKSQRKSIENLVLNFDHGQNELFHPFHILSKSEYNNIKKNNIVLDNMRVISKPSHQYGSLTVFNIKKENIGAHLRKHFCPCRQENVIDISQVKKRFLTFTMRTSDFVHAGSDIKIFGAIPIDSSGMILLLIVTYDNTFSDQEKINQYINLFRKRKYSIGSGGIKNYHHGTIGESYGVGLVAKYSIDEIGLSFGEYSEKDNSNESETSSSQLYAIMDHLMELALKKPLEIIPNLDKNIMIVGNSVSKRIRFLTEKKANKLNVSQPRYYMSSQLNINSETLIPHTEFDHSSTVLYVPHQNPFYPLYYFEFQLNHFTSAQIRMTQGTSIVYSPNLLVHRQISSKKGQFSNNLPVKKYSNVYSLRTDQHVHQIPSQKNLPTSNFVNISSYFNNRLYNNIKKSLNRIQSIDDKYTETSKEPKIGKFEHE